MIWRQIQKYFSCFASTRQNPTQKIASTSDDFQLFKFSSWENAIMEVNSP